MIRIMKIVATILGLMLVVFVAKFTYDYKVESLKAAQNLTSSEITAEVRSNQLNCLTRNIYYEAGHEPFEGKVAVAQVTINRAESGKFPSDICKVVYQKDNALGLCQFSWYCNGDVRKPTNKAAYKESEIVARQVLLEEFRLPSLKHALYFHGKQINPGWKREQVATIGNHIFYK
jgi:spore germination cell wall hydrolase CwlJ-like protein